MYSCKRDVMERPRNVSSSGYCVNIKASRVRSSRINWEATTSLIESSFQRRFTTLPNTPTIGLSCRTSLQGWGSGHAKVQVSGASTTLFWCSCSCVQFVQSRSALSVSRNLSVFSTAWLCVSGKGSGNVGRPNRGFSRFGWLTYVDSPLSTINLLYQRNKMHTYVRALIE